MLLLQVFKHKGQVLVAANQQLRQRRALVGTTVQQALVQVFQLMGQIAYRDDARHACPALEGVQITLQR